MNRMQCQGEGSTNCLQDTLKTSMCANRLFPTARLSCKQVSDPSLKRFTVGGHHVSKSIQSLVLMALDVHGRPVKDVAGVYLQDHNMPGACYERTGMS